MRSERLGRNVSSGTRSRRGRSLPLIAQTPFVALRSCAAGALAPVSMWAMRQLLNSNARGAALVWREPALGRKRGVRVCPSDYFAAEIPRTIFRVRPIAVECRVTEASGRVRPMRVRLTRDGEPVRNRPSALARAASWTFCVCLTGAAGRPQPGPRTEREGARGDLQPMALLHAIDRRQSW